MMSKEWRILFEAQAQLESLLYSGTEEQDENLKRLIEEISKLRRKHYDR